MHFDAHVDTWPDNFGQAYAHGSPFYHAINEGLIDPHRMIQIGIRSPVQKEVMDWTLGKGVTVLSAQDVHAATPAAVAVGSPSVVGDAPAYLSFDIDALDPAFAPGTGTPEIGGLAIMAGAGDLAAVGGVRFAGMDVVEVAPAYDVSEITALAAATVVWEYLALEGRKLCAEGLPAIQKRITASGSMDPISALLAPDGRGGDAPARAASLDGLKLHEGTATT